MEQKRHFAQFSRLTFLLIFIFFACLTARAQVATGGSYSLDQSVIASGGGQNSTGGTFSLDGTIGQPLAGVSSAAAPFSVDGGFWQTVFNPGGVQPPAIFLSFSPTSVSVGGVSTLTITFVNPSTNTVALTELGVTNSFPSGLEVDAAPASTNTCGGTLTAAAGATGIDLSGGSVPVNGSCAVSVTVKATTAGEKVNTTGAVTSTNGGAGGTASATLTVNQSTGNYSISGTVTYANTPVSQTPPAVSGVNLNATGASALSAISDASGFYQLSGLANGESCTVTPSKTGDINGINSLDAARIQQHLVGLTTLTPNQLLAADTDGSGAVNSLDATRIQQHLVGIQSSNIIGRWKFVPPNRQYNAVTDNLTGENYQAILIGEVSGNWAAASGFAEAAPVEEATAPIRDDPNDDRQNGNATVGDAGETEREPSERRAGRTKQSAAAESAAGTSVAVSLPANATASNGTTVTIPISVGTLPPGTSIESFDFSVFFDPTVLQPASPAGSNTNTLSAACSVFDNSPTSGRVIVSGACSKPPITTGSGTLFNLKFNVIGAANRQTTLTFTNPANLTDTFQFNNGAPSAATTNGQFTATAPAAAGVSVSGRAMTGSGRGIGNVTITMIDGNGNQRTTQTSSFGYYRFETVAAGAAITVTARAKRFTFRQDTQTRSVFEAVENVDFVADEPAANDL